MFVDNERNNDEKEIVEIVKFIETQNTIPQTDDNQFIPGQVYSLQGKNCDAFVLSKRFYKIIHIINSLFGININVLVVQQIGDPNCTTWCLTRSDCTKLGIEYTAGLQLFPMSIEWKHEQRFDDKEMISNFKNQTSERKTPKIYDKVLIRLNGFTYTDNHNTTIYNYMHDDASIANTFDEQNFKSKLKIKIHNKNCNFEIIQHGTIDKYSEYVPQTMRYKFIDDIVEYVSHAIYIVIKLPEAYDENKIRRLNENEDLEIIL